MNTTLTAQKIRTTDEIKRDRAETSIGPDNYLRPLTAADVTQGYVDSLRDPEVTRFLYGVKKIPQTWETVSAYVDFNHTDPDNLLLGIFIGTALIGTVRLHAFDAAEWTCHLGICIFDKTVWRTGIGARALSGGVELAIRDLGCKRVIAGVDADNAGSQKLFERAGFRTDPAWRYRLDGRETDVWIFEDTR